VKKVLPLLVLIGACAPDIAQNGAPPGAVTPLFDLNKLIVPLPNDLAKDPTTGKIVVPPSPTDTAAQTEFNRDYLGQLDGFPFESSASVSFTGDLKVESVSAKTVLVLDVTNPAAPAPVDNINPIYVPPTKSIVIQPPSGVWTRGHHYVVALVGGKDGLRGAGNEDVIGSESWALVSGTTPLITCVDPKNLDTCTLNVDIIPSTKTDPAEKLKDEKTKALQIEQIRAGYSPILDALALKGIPRANIPQIWTFSIIDSGEMTFDPANGVVPFPNDVLRDPSTGKVNLPNPKTGKPLTAADCQTTDTQILLACGLNTLDGFSTLAPPISESSDTLGAVAQATLAGGTLSTANVGLAPLKPGAPKEIQTKPAYTPCLNCLSSKDANGNPQSSPQQLQWKLDAPLDEKTTYAAYVTTDPKDDKGRNVIPNPVFALVRSAAPLVENGHSAVNILTDDEASLLEPLRVGYKPMFDALETQMIHRANISLAFPFTTQSESTTLVQLTGYPAAIPGLPDFPAGIADVTGTYQGIAASKSIPVTNIGKFFAGAFVTPVAVTGPGGTFNTANPAVLPVRFAMSVPAGTAPPNGWPVLLFGHGFTRGRNDFLAFANAAAGAGHIVISADVLFHGDRSTCTGSKLATKQASDDASCADPVNTKCDEGTTLGLCVLRNDAARNTCNVGPLGDAACNGAGQGQCAADGKCQGFNTALGVGLLTDAGGLPVISGWNYLNPAAFFGTRDNLRQQVIDLSQLVRILKSTNDAGLAPSFRTQLAGANGGALAYDTTKIDYAGQSLGGIDGALFTSVSPDVHKAVLNVPGGAWSSIILNTVSFKPVSDPLLQALAAEGILPGTPQFDTFFATVQWILDPADPANMAYRVTHPVDLGGGVFAPPADRKAFIQFIEGDQAVPNVSTFALLEGANRTFSPVPPSFGCAPPLYCYEFTEKGDNFDTTTATPDTRHGFLLAPPSGSMGGALTVKAQTQAATFLATGALP
jgi:hypothetical protein